MTPRKPSPAAFALVLLAAPAAQAQDTVPGNVLIAGRETGVLYALPTGLAASLCGIDASRATEAAGALTGALAGSRLILCDVPQAKIDETRLSPVTLAAQSPAPAATTAAPGQAPAEEEAQLMVRISVGGAIVEVTPEQAAEACGMDVATIRADASALAAGAGDPVSATDTGAAATAAPAAGSTAGIGSPAAAEEVDPDATTTNDPTGMAAEAPAPATSAAGATDATPAADAPPAAADAICEISREAAEAMGLPAPD
jgi:hypothetical protein